MKKIISLLLVLAMCTALFAGCTGGDNSANTTTAPTETTGDTKALSNAREYLYTMYKGDAGTVTAVDYSVVTQVSVGTESYVIDWTIEAVSGDTSYITVVPGDTYTTIQITPNYSGEEVQYNLVGTLTDANGNTESVSFAHTVPVSVKSDIGDGTYVISTNGLSLSALDESYNYGYPYANEVTESSYSNVDVVTITNVSGGVTIQDCYGRYIYLKGTYNSFNVSTEAPEEGHIWEIRTEGDNYVLVNIMNQKTLAYSSSYTSWGAYEELTDDHSSLLSITSAVMSEEDNSGEDEPEETQPEETAPSAGTSASVENGAKITMYNAANGAYVTSTEYTYTSSTTGNTKIELELTTDKASALVLTVEVEGDYVSFVTADGKYLYADGTNVKLVDKADDYTVFVLEAADGGYYVKCANATYNDKPQYLEIYSGYLTVYGFNSANTGIYLFELNAQ